MYKVVLAYEGTHYFGWQKTKTGPSVQEELEKAIFRITGETLLPEAASRTDRGVHAEGQVVQFQLQNEMAPHQIHQALNAVLPQDIRILSIGYKEFHPTLDALQKEYHYRICLGPVQDPIFRLYSWHFYKPLDLTKMREAAQKLIGERDVSRFANEKEENPICRLDSIDIISIPNQRLQIAIKGNRFLYKMVRNIVGTLIYIGCGKLETANIKGVTAPAHGLYLHQVLY